MCLEVPVLGRFLQNGVDGCNSKGLEAPVVYLLTHTFRASQSDDNVKYVAITRAKSRLVMVNGPTKPGSTPAFHRALQALDEWETEREAQADLDRLADELVGGET